MANQTQILNVSDEMKFDDNVQTKNVKEQEENMYSSSSDTTEELCSSSTNGTCGVRSVDVKSTEVNTEKGLKTRHFRELGVLFRLSDFFVLGCLQPGEIEG